MTNSTVMLGSAGRVTDIELQWLLEGRLWLRFMVSLAMPDATLGSVFAEAVEARCR